MGKINWSEVLPRAAEIVDEYDTFVTLRQLHYRLVSEATGGYMNTNSAYKRLSGLTAEARRAGEFPPLADLTRSITEANAWDSPKAALEEVAEWYRRDRTEGQKFVPLLVVEKATLTAQVYSWFGDPLGIKVIPLRGYSSESFDRVVRSSLEEERDYRVLYVGDHDPSGHDIERHAQQEIGLDIALWERVALTPEIVQSYGLPEAPGKASDSRARGFAAKHGKLVQVEVEALAPNDLRSLIQASLDTYWDTAIYEAVTRQEERERKRLEKIAASA